MPDINYTEAEIQAVKDNIEKATSNDTAVAFTAQRELAKAVELPLRKVLFSGNIINNIFAPQDYVDGKSPEYQLDLITPGAEKEFYAYTIPDHGRIPEKRVESDYLRIPTYQIGSSIDCTLRFLKNSKISAVQRMTEILEAGCIKKMNDDGWQTILAAAGDRNIIINDPSASQGQFTPRLITLAKTVMRRNGGGNSTTLNRSRLTDLYVSPEAQDDVRSWTLDLVADSVRANIYYSQDDGTETMRVYNVNIHGLDELGEGQEYQQYYTSVLGGSMAASDVEIAVGLDLQRQDSFVNPYVENLQVFEDNTLHRRRLFGMYCWAEMGFAVLDSRRSLLLSL